MRVRTRGRSHDHAPSSITAGAGGFDLNLAGSGFVRGAQAFFGGTALATTYVTDAVVQAIVPAYLVANSGSADVVLVNPTPGGGASPPVTFAIGAAGCSVACSAVAPSTAQCIGGECLVTLASTLASSGVNGQEVLVDSNTVYWTNRTGGQSLMKVPSAGGPSVVVDSDPNVVWDMTLHGGNIYFTDATLEPEGGVHFVPLDGGEDTLLFPSIAAAGIAVGASNVYWTVWYDCIAAGSGNGAIVKVAIADGTSTTLASNLANPSRLALDGSNVYWTDWGSGALLGTVNKVSTLADGGAPVILATGQLSPMGIAVDETSVYWANYGATSVGAPAVMKLTPK